jgi:hypothetical protein
VRHAAFGQWRTAAETAQRNARTLPLDAGAEARSAAEVTFRLLLVADDHGGRRVVDCHACFPVLALCAEAMPDDSESPGPNPRFFESIHHLQSPRSLTFFLTNFFISLKSLFIH